MGAGAASCLVREGSGVCPCHCSRPCPTAAGLPAVTRTWPPPPAWLERCPKWIKEPWKQAGSDSPMASRQWGVTHRRQADVAQGPYTSWQGLGIAVSQWLFGDLS